MMDFKVNAEISYKSPCPCEEEQAVPMFIRAPCDDNSYSATESLEVPVNSSVDDLENPVINSSRSSSLWQTLLKQKEEK